MKLNLGTVIALGHALLFNLRTRNHFETMSQDQVDDVINDQCTLSVSPV